jgi:hypothetical protein
MAWSSSVRPVVEIYLICARSAAGSAGQSLGAKFRFPNREMVSFERERLGIMLHVVNWTTFDQTGLRLGVFTRAPQHQPLCESPHLLRDTLVKSATLRYP